MGHNRLRHRLVDSDQSWSARQRRRRSDWLARTFPDIGDMHVVDLGGRLGTWHRATVRPARVTVVNLEQPPATVPEWAHVEQADACDLPPHVANGAYDLVFSNSVLEHLGGHERRLRFAAAARSLADRHWVQTPYRYFPIEPHWIAPGMQFLPIRLRTALARRWPSGTNRPAATKPPFTRCSGPNCWTARRCAITSPTRGCSSSGWSVCRSR